MPFNNYEKLLLRVTTTQTQDQKILIDHYRAFGPCLAEIRGDNINHTRYLNHLYDRSFLNPNDASEAAQQTMSFVEGVSDEAMQAGQKFAARGHAMLDESPTLRNIPQSTIQRLITKQFCSENITDTSILVDKGKYITASENADLISDLVNVLSTAYKYQDLTFLSNLVMSASTNEVLTFIVFGPKGMMLYVGINLFSYAYPTLSQGNGAFIKVVKRTMYSIGYKAIYRSVGGFVIKNPGFVSFCFTSVYAYSQRSYITNLISPENLKIARDAAYEAFIKNSQVNANGDGFNNIMVGVKKVLYDVTLYSLQSFQIYLSKKITLGARSISNFWSSNNRVEDKSLSPDIEDIPYE